MGSEKDTVSISQVFCRRENRKRMTDGGEYNAKKSFVCCSLFKLGVSAAFSVLM